MSADKFWITALLVFTLYTLWCRRGCPTPGREMWARLFAGRLLSPRAVEALLAGAAEQLEVTARAAAAATSPTPAPSWLAAVAVCQARLHAAVSLLALWRAALLNFVVVTTAPAPLAGARLRLPVLRGLARLERAQGRLSGSPRRARLHVAALSRGLRALIEELRALPQVPAADWPRRLEAVAADLAELARDARATQAALLDAWRDWQARRAPAVETAR